MTIEDFNYEYDCQGKHKQVGNRCMKCGAHIIDFGPDNEGDGMLTGWKLMKGSWGKKHDIKSSL